MTTKPERVRHYWTLENDLADHLQKLSAWLEHEYLAGEPYPIAITTERGEFGEYISYLVWGDEQ